MRDLEELQSKLLVLVVDDDARILRFLGTSLRLSGLDVVTATGGEEALRLVESARPDIMLLDIVMSPMDGLGVLKSLRATSIMPVIAMSAHASAAGEALRLGANAFVNKPFRLDELVKEIKTVLACKQ